MEFKEKLQHLRKQKGLTQEELADAIYISRTAISKWESGRGYPTIESLKMISKMFSTSVDQLISSEELLSLAETENRNKMSNLSDIVFGVLDCMMALLFFLPFFGQQEGNKIVEVSLTALKIIPSYIYIPYVVFVSVSVVLGVLILSLQNSDYSFWRKYRLKISLVISILLALMFIITGQPYAAVYAFSIILTKGFLLIKHQ